MLISEKKVKARGPQITKPGDITRLAREVMADLRHAQMSPGRASAMFEGLGLVFAVMRFESEQSTKTDEEKC